MLVFVCHRCAINTGEGNISSVHDNMTGFISTIPGSVAELPSFTEVHTHTHTVAADNPAPCAHRGGGGGDVL